MDRGQQFPYTLTYANSGGDEHWQDHLITAHHNESGEEVGYMMYGSNGYVDDIYVHPEHRRRGVATAMWEHAKSLAAKKQAPYPQHSDQRSLEGEAWSKSTGNDYEPAKHISKWHGDE